MSTTSLTPIKVDENISLVHPALPDPCTPTKASNGNSLPSPPDSNPSQHETEAPSSPEPVTSKLSPDAYMDKLLSQDPLSEQIFGVLDFDDFDGEVCVLRDRNTIYTLVPTYGCLEHDLPSTDDYTEDTFTCFCTLNFKTEDGQTEQTVQYEGKTSYFVPLGFLVLQDIQHKMEIFTNYTLLLNVSTNPISLWLAFDYEGCNEDCEVQYRELGGEHNDVSDYFNNFDFVLWWSDRPRLWDNDSQTPDAVYFTDMDRFTSSKKKTEGFLGVKEPFDLAMMSRDIKTDWKGCTQVGLDVGKTLKLMNDTREVKGKTLRAFPKKPPGWKEET